MAAFWSLAFLILFGCTTLHSQLIGWFKGTMSDPVAEGLVIPVVGVTVNPAFLITAPLCLVGLFVLFHWLQRPVVADLLIGTEGELRKVTWPKMTEVTNSALVVVAFVLLLMGFLAGADWALGKIMRYFLLGPN